VPISDSRGRVPLPAAPSCPCPGPRCPSPVTFPVALARSPRAAPTPLRPSGRPCLAPSVLVLGPAALGVRPMVASRPLPVVRLHRQFSVRWAALPFRRHLPRRPRPVPAARSARCPGMLQAPAGTDCHEPGAGFPPRCCALLLHRFPLCFSPTPGPRPRPNVPSLIGSTPAPRPSPRSHCGAPAPPNPRHPASIPAWPEPRPGPCPGCHSCVFHRSALPLAIVSAPVANHRSPGRLPSSSQGISFYLPPLPRRPGLAPPRLGPIPGPAATCRPRFHFGYPQLPASAPRAAPAPLPTLAEPRPGVGPRGPCLSW